MDYKILKSNNILIDNFIIKKRISVGNNVFRYPIKYLGNNLIIQTPILYLPFGMYKYGSKSYLDASFLNVCVDKEMSSYKSLINQLNNKVIQFISKRYGKKLSFIDSIKKSTEIYPDRMRFNLQEDILIFSEKKKLLDFEYLKAKSYTKFLVTPENIWVNEEKFGITWQILQIKIYPQTILNTYSFIDDDKKEETTPKSHPKYQKYFKMVSCGVPKDAVKHKMVLDNLDPNILDGDNSKTIDETKSKLKNSLGNIFANKLHNKNNQNNQNNQNNTPQTIERKINIKEEIKLAKQQKQEKNKKILSNVKQIIGYKPPSLMDILEMKNKLNKV
jgi:hypothetical protein